jgi:hypothetical protein
VVEILRVDRVLGSSRDHTLLIGPRRPAFLARHETRAHRHSLRTEGDGRRKPAPVGDPTRRKDGKRRDGSHDERQDRGKRDRPAHVSPCLESLRDDRVDARGGGGLCLVGRTDLHDHLRSSLMCRRDVRCRIAPEEHEDRDARRQALRDRLRGGGREFDPLGDDHVHAEGAVGERSRPLDALGDPGTRQPRRADDAEASGVRDRRGKLWAGAQSEPDVQDGLFDAQQIAERRPRHASTPA